jgi:DNA-binding NarL/FixJ family response regulator
MTVAGEASTAAEALDRIPKVKPDVVVMDVRFPDGDGIDVTARLSSALPGTRFLILTYQDDDSTMFEALRAGAYGLLPKHVPVQELGAAICDVAAGSSLFDASRVAVAAARAAKAETAGQLLDTLTPREMSILEMIAGGKTDREIAHALGLSDKTVRNNVSTMFMKMGVRHRTQAAVLFLRLHPAHEARSAGNTLNNP